MPDKKLTDELLNELLDAPNIDGYIKEHDFAAPSLSDYLKQLLQEKGLERSVSYTHLTLPTILLV